MLQVRKNIQSAGAFLHLSAENFTGWDSEGVKETIENIVQTFRVGAFFRQVSTDC